MLVIFIFSSDNGNLSSEKSNKVIIRISEVLTGEDLDEETEKLYIKKYELSIRKLAHFSVYFILGLLLISLVSEYMVINYKSLLLGIVLSFLYACSDEVHQLFVDGRSGNIIDVLIDTFGSTCGVYLYYFIYKLRRKSCE